MLKRVLEVLIIVVMVSYIKFSVKSEECKLKLENFYSDIKENAINYIDDDKVYLVFDYDYIDSLINVYFSNYEVSIVKNNECYFFLKVVIRENFFLKHINEGYMIERGSVYEEFN